MCEPYNADDDVNYRATIDFSNVPADQIERFVDLIYYESRYAGSDEIDEQIAKSETKKITVSGVAAYIDDLTTDLNNEITGLELSEPVEEDAQEGDILI